MKTNVMILILLFILSPQSLRADVTDGLVGWWKLDETAGNALDSSGSGNTATPNGTTILTTGCKIRNCRSFNGSSDYINTATNQGNGSALQIFSVSAWFKTSAATGKLVGIENSQTGTGSASYDRHLYMGTNGKIYFGVYTTSAYLAVSTNTLTDGLWHYAVGTCSGANGNITLYIDGVMQQQTAIVGTPYSSYGSSYWRIGNYKLTGSWTNGTDSYFSGSIDDVRVYNRALSQNEISAIYLTGTPHVSVKGGGRISGMKVN